LGGGNVRAWIEEDEERQRERQRAGACDSFLTADRGRIRQGAKRHRQTEFENGNARIRANRAARRTRRRGTTLSDHFDKINKANVAARIKEIQRRIPDFQRRTENSEAVAKSSTTVRKTKKQIKDAESELDKLATTNIRRAYEDEIKTLVVRQMDDHDRRRDPKAK